METEYEATFLDINKDEMREKLKKVGAKLIKPEFMQKRIVFNLPKGQENGHAWLRVRDAAEEFLKLIGCERKAYQETKRQIL